MLRKYSYIHTFCINTASESIEFYIYPLGLFSVIMQVLVWQQCPFSFKHQHSSGSVGTQKPPVSFCSGQVVLTLQMQ